MVVPAPSLPAGLVWQAVKDDVRNNSTENLRAAVELSKGTSFPSHSYKGFISKALQASVDKDNLLIAKYLIEEEEAHVPSLSPGAVGGNVSTPLLELLVKHGWDVNMQEI